MKPIVAGNWKMNKSPNEGVSFVGEVANLVLDIEKAQVIFCPPFPGLQPVVQALDSTPLKVGAQNCHWESQGAFTGEVSVPMLIDSGVEYVIVGHSERRHVFHEPDDWINKKVHTVREGDLTAILCIGETLEQRERGETELVLVQQLRDGLQNVPDLSSIIIAYEPVWAIGTGRTASAEQVAEAHTKIQQCLRELYDEDRAYSVPLLYGGSVKPDNARELIETPGVDGFLIGGASLQVDAFVSIIKQVETHYVRN